MGGKNTKREREREKEREFFVLFPCFAANLQCPRRGVNFHLFFLFPFSYSVFLRNLKLARNRKFRIDTQRMEKPIE